jgi:hypothetical protein
MIHFKKEEFDSPDLPGSGENMDAKFLNWLDAARDMCDFGWVITSGYRTKAHNNKVGGVDSSAHTRGYAADIRCQSSHQRYEIIRSLLAVGFRRIGIASNFVHVDNDPDKPAGVVWTY